MPPYYFLLSYFTLLFTIDQNVFYSNSISHTLRQILYRVLYILLGEDYNDLDKRKEQSLEFQVSRDTPPTFLWHTVTDDCVPVENSLL